MYSRYIKPFLDRAMAFILIVLFSPVMVTVALLVWSSMGRPILFRQPRPGKDEQIFKIYKFRTMSDARDNDGNFLPDAQRLKGVGKWIRSRSLDELPQLFNVLKGDMSFVGPRPLLVEYLPLYNRTQRKRHSVKPGITGWAQVNGRNAISWEQKFSYDVWYTEHISFLLDMKILWMTLRKVVHREGINAQESVTMEKFKGNSDV